MGRIRPVLNEELVVVDCFYIALFSALEQTHFWQPVSAGFRNGGSSVALRFRKDESSVLLLKPRNRFGMHIPMHNTICSTIATAKRQGLEDKCEIVGQGLFGSRGPHCRCGMDRTAAVAWTAAVMCRA